MYDGKKLSRVQITNFKYKIVSVLGVLYLYFADIHICIYTVLSNDSEGNKSSSCSVIKKALALQNTQKKYI